MCRLLLFLTSSYKRFRRQLNQSLKNLIQLLDAILDPQVLCLLLQSLAIIALDPSTHKIFLDSQIEEFLMAILLPTNEFFYTNTTTKFGHFVKYHAARVLIYTGLFERVGSRVNLFSGEFVLKVRLFDHLDQYLRANSANSRRNSTKPSSNSSNEDDFVYETCFLRETTDSKAMSIESIVKNILSVSFTG
jgi:phosphatidylinositol phospholipase C epsilon